MIIIVFNIKQNNTTKHYFAVLLFYQHKQFYKQKSTKYVIILCQYIYTYILIEIILSSDSFISNL